MASPPTLDQVSRAGYAVHLLSREESQERRRREAGDALMALFLVLATRQFPEDPEPTIVRRVELMLAAFFLRGDLDPRPVTPPDEPRARAVIQGLAGMRADQLDERIDAEVGEATIGLFKAMAQKAFPAADLDGVGDTVHLMLLAYLARGALAEA